MDLDCKRLLFGKADIAASESILGVAGSFLRLLSDELLGSEISSL